MSLMDEPFVEENGHWSGSLCRIEVSIFIDGVHVFVVGEWPSGFEYVAPRASSCKVLDAVVALDLVDVIDVDGGPSASFPRYWSVSAVGTRLGLSIHVVVDEPPVMFHPALPASLDLCQWMSWVFDLEVSV